MTPTIEKNIPVPLGKHNGKWAFVGEMEVGDSVFLDDEFTTQTRWLGQSAVKRKYPERTFTSRSVEGGIRIWRIK